MLFHVHKFKEVSRVYTPPVTRKIEGEFYNEQVDKILHGFTNIEQVCERCGKIICCTVIGKTHE